MTDDRLEPGRELDALVAEKVMGWYRDGDMLVPPRGDKRRVWAAEWDNNGLPDWLPGFSTNMAAAWQVVEKVFERFDAVMIYCDAREQDHVWRCRIKHFNRSPKENEFPFETVAVNDGWEKTTAAHAICLSALKAYSLKDERDA